MTQPEKYASLSTKRLIMIGFGSIGPAVLPLILRHIDIDPKNITVIAADDHNRHLLTHDEIAYVEVILTPQNYETVLRSQLGAGDILVNVSVNVSSLDLIRLCQRIGALYIDTSNETWPTAASAERLTTHDRRARALAEQATFANGPTALVCHGANPGLVSHFVKQALLDIAQARDRIAKVPQSPHEWALLSKNLQVVSIHISERDSQLGHLGRRHGEYVNTWSVDGLLDEASEYAGFAWGSHEPHISEHIVRRFLDTGKCRVIELTEIGAAIKMNSWVPGSGKFHGFLIPHPEAFSIAELLSYRDGAIDYQPTVHFVYQPCNDALLSIHDAVATEWPQDMTKRLLFNDVVHGMDELGVLVLRQGTAEIYWYGSRLDIDTARRSVANNNATSLQVAAGILAGIVWVIENPQKGMVEPEQVDFQRALAIAAPYLGEMRGYWSNWNTKNLSKAEASISWPFSDLSVNLR